MILITMTVCCEKFYLGYCDTVAVPYYFTFNVLDKVIDKDGVVYIKFKQGQYEVWKKQIDLKLIEVERNEQINIQSKNEQRIQENIERSKFLQSQYDELVLDNAELKAENKNLMGQIDLLKAKLFIKELK